MRGTGKETLLDGSGIEAFNKSSGAGDGWVRFRDLEEGELVDWES